jgi:hypothetical protein
VSTESKVSTDKNKQPTFSMERPTGDYVHISGRADNGRQQAEDMQNYENANVRNI